MLQVGDQAPPFSGTDVLKNQSFSLSSQLGKTVVLQFHGITWCGACQIGIPVQQELYNEFLNAGEPVQFVVLSVNEDNSSGAISNALTTLGLTITMPWLADPSIPEAYGVGSGIPMYFVLDAEHKICRIENGLFHSNPQNHKAALKSAVEQCLPPDSPFERLDRYWAAVAIMILGGVTVDGGGIIVTPGGGGPVPPWDPLRLRRLPAAKRDALVGLAVSELADIVAESSSGDALRITALQIASDAVMRSLEEAKGRAKKRSR